MVGKEEIWPLPLVFFYFATKRRKCGHATGAKHRTCYDGFGSTARIRGHRLGIRLFHFLTGGLLAPIAFNISVNKPPNHSLILSMVIRRLRFEEINTLLAQCQRDFYPLFVEC